MTLRQGGSKPYLQKPLYSTANMQGTHHVWLSLPSDDSVQKAIVALHRTERSRCRNGLKPQMASRSVEWLKSVTERSLCLIGKALRLRKESCQQVQVKIAMKSHRPNEFVLCTNESWQIIDASSISRATCKSGFVSRSLKYLLFADWNVQTLATFATVEDSHMELTVVLWHDWNHLLSSSKHVVSFPHNNSEELKEPYHCYLKELLRRVMLFFISIPSSLRA